MSARFYYYPEPNGSHLVTIDLGEELGELFSDIPMDVIDGISMTGGIQRSVGGGGEVITIQRDRLNLGEDLAYKFAALQNHLDRGFSCAFTSDHTKAWCAPIMNYLGSGYFDVNVFSNPFNSFVDPLNANIIPSVGDYVVIESKPPAMLHELHKLDDITNLSGLSNGNFLTKDRINFQYNRRAFARWYRFWPVLKRPAQEVGKNIITNEGGRLFSLSLKLVPDYSTLFAYHPESFDGVVQLGDNLVTTSPATGTLPTGGGITSGGGGGGIDGTVSDWVNGASLEAEESENIIFDEEGEMD
tara:strand:+ start:6068 stop:6967 length:900 start_codon:yes stop_codon:yes gene_type:complete